MLEEIYYKINIIPNIDFKLRCKNETVIFLLRSQSNSA